MEIFEGLTFEPVAQNDVDDLAPIMKRAFDEDARRHLGVEVGGPPGYDDGSFIRRWYFDSQVQARKVSLAGTLIGAIAVFIRDNHEGILGSVFIDPLYQDKGFGLKIWRFIEHRYPDIKKWSTETPGFSKRNHNFYINKCGFKVVRIDNPTDFAMYMMEKEL